MADPKLKPLGVAEVVVQIEMEGDTPKVGAITPKKIKITHCNDEVVWRFENLPKDCSIDIVDGTEGPVDDCKPLKHKPFKKPLKAKPGQSTLSSGPTDDESIGDPGKKWRKSWSYKIVPRKGQTSGVGLDPWVIVEKP